MEVDGGPLCGLPGSKIDGHGAGTTATVGHHCWAVKADRTAPEPALRHREENFREQGVSQGHKRMMLQFQNRYSHSNLMETPYFERLTDCSVCLWICGGLVPCFPSALLATKKALFGIKTCRLAILLIMQNKFQGFQTF